MNDAASNTPASRQLRAPEPLPPPQLLPSPRPRGLFAYSDDELADLCSSIVLLLAPVAAASAIVTGPFAVHERLLAAAAGLATLVVVVGGVVLPARTESGWLKEAANALEVLFVGVALVSAYVGPVVVAVGFTFASVHTGWYTFTIIGWPFIAYWLIGGTLKKFRFLVPSEWERARRPPQVVFETDAYTTRRIAAGVAVALSVSATLLMVEALARKVVG